MAEGGPQKRVDEALADWREAERTLDVASEERQAAEAKARTVEHAETVVAQTAALAEVAAEAARQAQEAAHEAVVAVAEVSDATQDEIDRAIAAERSAQEAQEAARAQHRAVQDDAMRRYREDDRPSPSSALGTEVDPGTEPEGVAHAGTAD